jgi:hypothetical protein
MKRRQYTSAFLYTCVFVGVLMATCGAPANAQEPWVGCWKPTNFSEQCLDWCTVALCKDCNKTRPPFGEWCRHTDPTPYTCQNLDSYCWVQTKHYLVAYQCKWCGWGQPWRRWMRKRSSVQ